MTKWIFRAAVLSALLAGPAAAATGDFSVQCELNGDKSAMVVIASNATDTSYSCSAFCRAKMTGAAPFDRLNCNFSLPKGAKAKTVCDKDGGKPNFYSEVGPTKMACVPR